MEMTKEDLIKTVRSIQPGQSFIYHRGYIAYDRQFNYPLQVMANTALALEKDGTLCLTQRKHGPNDYTYFATKRRVFVPS